MSVSRRIAVVYGSTSDLQTQVKVEGDEVKVSGSKGAILQRRWVVERDNGDTDGIDITWRNYGNDWSSVIRPETPFGLNVYSKDKILDLSVSTGFYNVYHDSTFSLGRFLPADVNLLFMQWQEDNDYSVHVTKHSVEIIEYSRFETSDELVLFQDNENDPLEAGFFIVESSNDNEVTLSGARAVWENLKLQQLKETVLFYQASHTYSEKLGDGILDLAKPVGLHPKVVVDLAAIEPVENCEYYMFTQLPLDLFVDKFQTNDVIVYGETDLELPVYKLQDKQWGSEALHKLKAGSLNEIIFHSRYVKPSNSTNSYITKIKPMVFQSCESKTGDVSENPFYGKGMGYERFFTNDTVFTHLDSKLLSIEIPSGNLKDYNSIYWITTVCLAVSMVYLFSKLTSRRR